MALGKLDIYRCPSCIGGKFITTEETGNPSPGSFFSFFLSPEQGGRGQGSARPGYRQTLNSIEVAT